ncbi:MAG: hypothetical protein KTR30_07010 [Saprospiraceae bacterium]|nr:hypothetical protein [Saprospiraceae bacterium]
MKQLLVCSFIFFYGGMAAYFPAWGLCAPLKAQPCLPAGITFSSQAAIDNFANNYPGCTMILGTVLIEESVVGDINNLHGLSPLVGIGRNLAISGTYSLESLAGLDNLLEVGESLSIAGNRSLENVEALGQLSLVGQSLRLSSNGALKDLKGFQSIKHVSQDLSITSNLALRNLSGLDSLQNIGGQLSLLSNPVLTNLVGLSSLTSIGNVLEIFDNPLLQSLSACGQLRTVGGDLIIDRNPSLLNLRGLEGLQEVGNFLQIVNNASLNNINGLLGVTQIGDLLQVYNNPSLTSLTGLDSIDHQSIKHLALLSSPNLNLCSVKSLCDYLKDPDNGAAIDGNLAGCNSRQEILASCAGNGLNSRPGQTKGILLFPNPTTGLVKIKGRAMNGAQVMVIDSAGRILYRTEVEEDSFQLQQIAAGFFTVRIWNDQHSF